jgi:hypothetical protein
MAIGRAPVLTGLTPSISVFFRGPANQAKQKEEDSARQREAVSEGEPEGVLCYVNENPNPNELIDVDVARPLWRT